jgi:hypothetical protein
MIVAGFDLSKVATGVGILDGTKALHAEAYRCVGSDDGALFAGFKIWVRGTIVGHAVQYVAVEQPLRTPMIDPRTKQLEPKSNMQTYLWLYGLRAVVLAVCADVNVPAVEVNQGTWRKSFVGNGHATKEQSFALAKQLYPKLKSKDAAEAIGVAWWLNGMLSQTDMFKREVA